MRKYLAVLFLLLLLPGCRSEAEAPVSAPSEELALDPSELPRKERAVGKAAVAFNSWTELRGFDQSLDRIYEVNGREDYVLIVEELLELFEVMGASQGPEELQSPQIISRFNVVKTFLLKIQADLQYRVDPKESTIELLTAYNAAIEQCNILVNTTLDPKTLFDD